jgi:hypothetical protein
MGCFKAYEKAIKISTGISDNLDAAVALAGCVAHGIHGSGPLYHPAKGLTKKEQQKAHELAERVKKAHSDGQPSLEQYADLIDDAYDFAISISVARGAVHLGPSKVSLEKHEELSAA